MRISDTQFSQMMLQSLQINNAGLGKVMQQMATGDRLTKLSDDPMASIKLLNLDREGAAISQYQRNIANVKTTLSSQEVHLDSVNESLKSMRELVLWGANGSLTDEDRLGMMLSLRAYANLCSRRLMRKTKKGTICSRVLKPIHQLFLMRVVVSILLMATATSVL
ncbi:flagellar hook-associated protein FlgL [Vibrio maritimus]|uniref:Flagellar hook-associated protein FlgL n=1 Tax=Vibrio maritimus TaxID=990268 RepID=A0A090S730_9VIBR|nr:flagellar hook-associated protein FlgL [Vibrio maritimus]